MNSFIYNGVNFSIKSFGKAQNIIVGNCKYPTCNHSHHMVYLCQIKEVNDYDRKQYCKRLTI